ncbi:MAG: tetratricopeptide repeat protein [Myxococcales bacterium]|nr:tetratricopeptide repeat protein [Myxococcales bacterium]
MSDHEREIARLREAPDDDEAWLVHADALVARGEPRGELAQLQHLAQHERDVERRATLEAEVASYVRQHAEALLGDLRLSSALTQLRWRAGYIVGLRFADGDGVVTAPEALLERLLASPACVLLRTLTVGQLAQLEGDYGPLVAVLRSAARRDVPATRSLRELSLGSGVDGSPLESGLDRASLDYGAVAELCGELKSLRALALEGVSENLPLAAFPATLERLALRSAERGDSLAEQLAALDTLRGALADLDLRGGTLTDRGAAALAGASWPRQVTLDLRENLLEHEGEALLRELPERVRVRLTPQRAADELAEGGLGSVLQEPPGGRCARRLRAGRALVGAFRFDDAVEAFELVLDEPGLDVYVERSVRVGICRALRDGGRVREARSQLEALLAFERGVGSLVDELWALVMIAIVDEDLGQMQSSSAHYARALERLDAHRAASVEQIEPIALRRLRAQALGGQAKAQLTRGRPREAIAAYERVRALHEDNGDAQLVAEVDERIASCEQMMGNYAAAEVRYRAALKGYSAANNQRAAAKALGNLATIYWHLGRWNDTEKTYLEALEASRTVGDRRNEATVLSNLCQGYMSRGRSDEAERYGARALALFEQLGHRAGAARVEHYLADCATIRGDLELASQRMARALAVYRELGDERAEAQGLATLGSIELDRDELEAARATHARAVELYQRCADRYGENMARVGAGGAALGLGDHEAARDELSRALAGSEALDNDRGRVVALAYLGLERFVAGDAAAALEHYDASLALCSEQESPHQRARTWAWQGAAYAAAGDHGAARDVLAKAAKAFESLDDGQGGEQLAVARAYAALLADPTGSRAKTSARAAANAEYVGLEARLLRAKLREALELVT